MINGPKKFLGIDHGLKNIGLAFGDSDMRLAVPYEVISGLDENEALEIIRNVCVQEEIDEIVIGVPVAQDGNVVDQTKIVEDFILNLEDVIDLPVSKEDERMTSKMAEKLAGRKGDDSVAAAIILQGYLDRELSR